MDIGGFCVENRYVNAYNDYLRTGKESPTLDEWRELNTRWFQFGALCPLFRSHGQYPYREPWHIAPQGHEAYESMAYYLDLRYCLMPYLYSLAGAAHHTDYTLMRALAMDFTHDKNTYHVGDQYMFGPALMVAPVYEYKARTRNVYLPEGRTWYDFYTGTPHQGGQTLKADAPYGRIPLFVPAGSILVTGRPMQYADELPADTLTIHVYQGADVAFTLYEDDGNTYAYERGEYLTIPLSYNEKKHALTIGAQQGTYSESVKERTLHIVTTSADGHQREVKTVTYKGKAVKVKLL
jgi:alpha-D-xyloside xylohydrolase